ncbi:MAG: amidohydrolase family protein [Oligoflexales bacterium]|nr:amidohydrolase family protein [Oligoflexales bacterium]
MTNLASIDVHIHLAGTGCCDSGAWLSPKLRQRYTIKLLQFVHNISNKMMEEDFDCEWIDLISNRLNSSKKIDYGVVLGFDGAYDFNSGEIDYKHSQLIVPSAWVFDVCRKNAKLLPGPSVNPFRKDALKELEYCIEHKAVLIKWLPSAQMIDPANLKIKEFLEKLKNANIPLLIHIGGERTFYSYFPQYNDAERIKFALDLGVTIICAHSGTSVLLSKEEDQVPEIEKLLATYPHLWVDNSGLCNPSRFHQLQRLVDSPLIQSRTLYGSDFPVPSNAYYFFKKFGFKKTLQIEAIKNSFDRDVAIKDEFGFDPLSLTRAHQVLANLDYWL